MSRYCSVRGTKGEKSRSAWTTMLLKLRSVKCCHEWSEHENDTRSRSSAQTITGSTQGSKIWNSYRRVAEDQVFWVNSSWYFRRPQCCRLHGLLDHEVEGTTCLQNDGNYSHDRILESWLLIVVLIFTPHFCKIALCFKSLCKYSCMFFSLV